MRYMRIEEDVQLRVRQYYEYFFSLNGMISNEDIWLQSLPPLMRASVLESQFSELIRNADLFCNRLENF